MVLCPCLSTAVGGTDLHRNPAGNSTIDPCANCRCAACTCAGRNSMTTDDGLREGARQVFEIAIEELFIESKLWNADVKYSFPYEDTAGVPVDEGAKRNGAPLRWVECFDGALVLLRLCGLLVYAVCSEQERSGRNTRFVIWSKNNRSYRNEWVILALLALIIPGVSAMATTALLDGTGTGARAGTMVYLNDGTGGKWGNGILAYPTSTGVLFDDCGSSLSYAQTLPAASVGISSPGYLLFSANNIINTADAASQFAISEGISGTNTGSCVAADTWSAVLGAPGFAAVATTDLADPSATFNPQLSAAGAACTGAKDASPNGDAFFSTLTCKGAFGSSTDNWLASYLWLACKGKMVGASCTSSAATAALAPPFVMLRPTVNLLAYTYTTNTALGGANISYILASQVFVSATLTIPAGTTLYALPVPNGVATPALVVLKGGMLVAAGTASSPITLTILSEHALSGSVTAVTDSSSAAIALDERGKWGGLILLGKAPTNVATTAQIEGIVGYTYGGTAPTESSSSLQYVRVWHGGAIIGANNEINGITFGGVGSGTTVAYCEVAYNADDAFEFFGGTVNVKYLSALFVTQIATLPVQELNGAKKVRPIAL
jgi:hypothetical protein